MRRRRVRQCSAGVWIGPFLLQAASCERQRRVFAAWADTQQLGAMVDGFGEDGARAAGGNSGGRCCDYLAARK
jgi:hypothetical protein